MVRFPRIVICSVFLFCQISFAKLPVIVISGGENPESNAERYYTKLGTLMKLFPIHSSSHHFLVAGGPGDELNSPWRDEKGLEQRDENHKIKLVRRDPPPGYALYRAAILKDIYKTFKEVSEKLTSEDRVLIYISDHGNLRSGSGSDKQKGTPVINLWHEWMTPDDLRDVVRLLGASRKIVIVQDQCFSGDMEESLFGVETFLSKKNFGANVCGFAAAAPGRTSFSTQQLIPTLERYLADPSTAALITDDSSKKIKLNEFFKHAQLDFDTVPLSSSEAFLLSYFEKYEDKINGNGINIIEPIKQGDHTKVQKENYLKLISKLEKLESNHLHNLKDNELCSGYQTSLSKTEVCISQLEKKGKRVFEAINNKILFLKSAFLKYVPPKSRDLLEEYLPLSRKKVRNLSAKLAEYEEESRFPSQKIEKLKKKIQREKDALAILIDKAKDLGEQQEAALAGKDLAFNQYLESQKKGNEIQELNQLKTLAVQIKESKSLILKFQRVHQLLAALEILEKDPEALAYYFGLVKCENEPFKIEENDPI